MLKKLFILTLVSSTIIGVMVFRLVHSDEDGPWYLGCSDRDHNDYLLKTETKPHIDSGFIVIGKDVFVTPEPGMTCRIVTVKEIEEENRKK